MKKKKRKTRNVLDSFLEKELLTICLYFIIFPALGIISYKLYYNYVYSIDLGFFIQIVLLSFIVTFNVGVFYFLNYYNKRVPRIYLTMNGLIINVLLGFAMLIYISYSGTDCNLTSYNSSCYALSEAVQYMKIIMTFSVSYTIINILVFNIANKMRKPIDFSLKSK